MRTKTIYNIALFCFLCIGASPLGAAPEAATAPSRLVFGFLPILSSERLVERFLPLVNYLSERTGIDIRMETAADFATFIARTQKRNRYAILFTAPHLFYLAQQRGYRALARVDLEAMRAVIVVPRNSPIRSLQQLRGHSMATTGPLALSTLLIRERLAPAGLMNDDAELRWVDTPSHIAALLSAYRGNTDAAAVMQPVFRRVKTDLRHNMRVIASSAGVPHIPLAVAPWLDEVTAQRLRDILLQMHRDAEGRQVLAHLDWPSFVPVGAHDYDRLRSLAEQIEVP